MPFALTATVNTNLPGSVDIGVSGDANTTSTIYRIDGSLEKQPVRNYTTTGPTGLEGVADAEAPLGRAVKYQLVGTTGTVLAESNNVTVPEPADGRSLLRSVLKPNVAWMWVEPTDEQFVTWRTSTRSYEIVGSDTPVIVAEVRRRHEGSIMLLCKTIEDANAAVSILRDGLPMLLRHSTCASIQTRDMLFYALDVSETIVSKNGWRVLEVRYQTTKFVVGDTEEPAASWTFEALSNAHTDFAEMSASYANFMDIALNRPIGGA